MTEAWESRARHWLRGLFPESRRFAVEVRRERVWGTIWTVATDEGTFWFKRAAPDLTTEVALLELLVRSRPDVILAPRATHATERWIVTADQGQTLAPISREEGPHHYVETAVALAGLQRSVSEHADQLARIGLHAFAPEDFTDRIADHLSWCAALPVDHPVHLDVRARQDVHSRAARLAAQWAELMPSVPTGLDHNDLHLGNVFRGPLLSDWGDAVIGHPFASLRALVVPARKVFGPAVSDEVRRRYLECWGDPEALGVELELAMRMAAAQRFLAWRRMGDLEAIAEYHEWITVLLTRLGDPIDEISVP